MQEVGEYIVDEIEEGNNRPCRDDKDTPLSKISIREKDGFLPEKHHQHSL
jgi:hypothetical protein